MNKKANSYYIVVIVMGLLCYAIIHNLSIEHLKAYISPYFWHLFLGLGFINGLAHFIATRGLGNLTNFHLFYMTSLTVRMLASLTFLLVFQNQVPDAQGLFTDNFIVIYFVYMALEIYFLLTNLRPDSNKNGNDK